jgi:hypothetical protein
MIQKGMQFKIDDCLPLKFPIEYSQIMVDCGTENMNKQGGTTEPEHV